MIITVLLFLILVISYFGYWSGRGMDGYYNSKPMFISHRGITTKYPENTIEAFKHSIKKGFQAIELDVLCSKDGVIYCSHNYHLEEETNNIGDLNNLKAIEIDEIVTGKNYSPKNQKNIPRLENVLKIIPNGSLLNIEIKFLGPFDFSTISKIDNIIKKTKKDHNILISSFNPFIVFYARWFLTNIRTAFLVETLDMVKWMHFSHPDCLHPRYDLLSDDLINKCKKRKLSINTWTVNSKTSIELCRTLDLDGIITDREDVCL